MIEKTLRGFEVVRFQDIHNEKCTLQQSSIFYDDEAEPGSSAVWLGIGDNRMHLDQKTVSNLMAYLGHWLKSGSFGG